jgi:hypothetical protein
VSAIAAPQVHTLKTDPRSWEDIDAGTRLVDLRPADRGFRPGDLLVLREYDPYQVTVDPETQVESPGKFTGRVCQRRITHILPGGQYGLALDHVALSLAAEFPTADEVAAFFHATYEQLAPSFGYATRKESAKPWQDVPEQNKQLMTAVAGAALDWLRSQGHG